MADRPAWMDDPLRVAWILNSLDARIWGLRESVKNLRKAYKNPYMGDMANWLADAYEAAVVGLETKRAEIKGKP